MSNPIAPVTAFVLHSRPYQEASLIFQLFTKEQGRMSLLAKGIKSKKSQARRANLQPFRALAVEFVGKGELKTLTHCEALSTQSHNAATFDERAMACAYYANELLLRALPEHQDFQALFLAYQNLLESLQSTSNYGECLRQFEITLLESIGLAPDCEFDIDGQPIAADKKYRFIAEGGFYLSAENHKDAFSGGAILSLIDSGYNESCAREVRNITRLLLQEVIGDRPLQSRKLWQHISLQKAGE